jgi:hypothetical protein
MGESVFEQMVTETTTTRVTFKNHISREDFELWKKDYTWEALHGQRYGQSFCNRFGIHDNHLFYNTGGIEWADIYINETYIART